WRLCATLETGSHARDRKLAMAAARYQHWSDCFHRPLWTRDSHGAAQASCRFASSIRLVLRHNVLYPSRRLVRLSVCDNFPGGAAHSSTIPLEDEEIVMVEELEQ